MKKITLVSIITLLLSIQFSYSQETFKRVTISNITQTTISQLNDIGIDMTCGVSIVNNSMTIELAEYQLNEIEHKGISYRVLIEDLSKFYSERAIRNLPIAAAEIKREKSFKKTKRALTKSQKSLTGKSLTINELVNNIGQYDECDEIDWEVPDNWNLNDSDSYPNETNNFGGCLTYDMVLQELDDMKALYPNIISTRKNASPTNQLTVEGRTLWMVRISDNPEVDEPTEPENLYQSLIHSREAATVMNQLYFMWYLLENYNSDPAIKNLVDNHALYFIPVFNPDGFVYNQTIEPDGGGLQRKNRNVGSNSCGTTSNGIDLNRNSAYYWGNGGASTTDVCSATYAGSGPFSENETQIMRDFVYEHDFKLALNHHSFKNVMLHGYAGTAIENPRPDEYSKYNHDMTFYNRYAHGPSTSISGLNSGNMNDWMLGGPAGVSANGTPTGIGSGKHTLSWTPENGLGSESSGSGFWPDPVNFMPIAKRAMRMNFLAAYFSGKYAKLHDLNQTDISSTTGNLQFGIENLGQNGNDTTPDTNVFTVTVTAITPNITINTASASQNFTASEILAQKTVDINYTLDGGIATNDEIQFKVVLTNDYASGNVLYEVIITKIFTPTLLTSTLDPTNFSNWTSSGSWASVTDGYNDASAIRSNNTIPYTTNQSQTLQYDGSLNLSSVESAVIQFYGKWDLERSFDYVQIEASLNGTSGWTPLCGRLTKPGSPGQDSSTGSQYSSTNDAGDSTNKTSADIEFQPEGEPLYDGDTQDKWSMEEIVIDASTNSTFLGDNSVFIRFNFNTDSSNRKDSYKNADFEGFSFDDFKVIALGCVTSVPTNLVASNETTDAATIDWDEVFNNSYDLRYKTSSSGTWTNVSDLDNNSNALSGLTPGTTYDVQVRSQCGTSTNSAYSGTINFTTLACDPPTSVTATDIGLSTVRVYWDEIPSATYDVRYRINGSSTWTTSSASLILDQPVYNVSGLTEATQYEVQVRTDCPGSGNSSYSVSTLFTTLGCAAPSNIIASDLFIDSANITWDALNPATYDLRYRENGTSTWTTISDLTDSAYNISGLNSNTTYDVEVRTDCSSSTSAYSSTINFTTLTCITPTSVTADDILSSGATINWDEIDGSDFDLRYKETSSGTWINVSDRTLNFYNIPDLTGATEYEVQVRTVCSTSENSSYTASTVFTTSACDDTISAFEYSESFETSFGFWNQETNDDIDWTRLSGLTPSNTSANVTGPSGAIDGSFYIYTESSGNGTGYPNMDAFLTSPCFDFNGFENAQMTFQYHMFGAAMGNLNVIVSTDNFQTSNNIEFTQIGSPASQTTGNSDPWLTAIIDLSAYDGQTIKVRFFGETGSSFTSDIAIDDIKVNADILSGLTPIASCQNINAVLDGTGNVTITAADVNDGSSVGNLSIDISSFTCSNIGTNNVTLTATDPSDSGNTDTCVAIVTIVDNTLPTIALTGAASMNVEACTGTYTELGATASDNCSVGAVSIGGDTVDVDTVGTYTITYNVTDANSNDAVQVTRTVNVVDTTVPTIALIGAASMNVEACTGTYTELGATADDDCLAIGAVSIGGDTVDVDTVGTYTITYNVTDANSNDAVQVTRTVNVVDTTVPTIALIGAASMNVEACTGTYTELGATADDDCLAIGAVSIGGDTVDVDTVGTYTITYNVTDANSNDAVQVTRTVNVVDTTVPTIALIGAASMNVEACTGTYTELGATADDDCLAIGAVSIGGDTVDVDTVGTYTITYNVTDANSNDAVQVTRTVNVVDTTVPTIALIGAASMNVEACTGTYTELGATADDDCLAIGAVSIGGDTVDVDTVGTYTITYNVTDANSNDAVQVTRTVNVVDTTVPTIALIGAASMNVEACTGTYTELGATADDDCLAIGAVSIGGDTVDVDTVGTYTITYNVTDANSNDAVQVTRTVNVVDTTVPTIALIGAASMNVEACTGTYTELGATADDDCLAIGAVSIGGDTVDVDTVGTYTITYNVTDANSNDAVQVTRTVNVVDTTVPTIALIGAASMNVEACTGTYTELGATADDDCLAIGAVSIGGDTVDVDTVGTYTITYNVTDANSNDAVQVTRTVNVVDTTVPTIALIGAASMNVEACTGTYTELGATADDDCLAIGAVSIGGDTVDVDTVGTYTITYNVTDANSNDAVQVTRTVNVVDTTVPTIALIGAASMNVEACTGTYTELGATADDDCLAIGAVSIGGDTVDVDTVGTYTITYNVTDANSNDAVQVTRTVNVVDTTVPTIALIGAASMNVEACTGTYTELGATADDDCLAIGAVSIGGDTVDVDTVGTYTITYNVTDANSNDAVQVTRTVNVVDTFGPNAICQNITIELDITDNASITASDIDGGSTDNCGIANLSASQTTFTTSDIGDVTVTLTVTDINGNIDTCDAIVTVEAHSLSADDFNLENISITPNPFNDNISIRLPLSFNNSSFIIKIFDLNGRLVINKQYSSMNSTINLSGLEKLEQAPYLFKMTSKETGVSIVKRLIKY